MHSEAASVVILPKKNGPSTSHSSNRHVRPRSSRDLSPHSLPRPRPDCTICLNPCASPAYRAPCDHYYCPGCLRELVEAATRDESLFPVKCCRQNLPTSQILPYLKSNRSLLALFQAKSVEFSTPSNLRVYCPTPTCSAFLGSSTGATDEEIFCIGCFETVCTSCKNAAHRGEPCAVAPSTVQLRTLAEANSWQTCPGCGNIVELQMGCFHITCRCKTEFCYLCAARWKNCLCAHWEENRLLDTATQRVINEFGRGAAIAAPALHAQRVQERVDRLRNDHFCRHTRWRYRSGAGTCEHCGHFLARYLLVSTSRLFVVVVELKLAPLKMCVGCSTLACVRCSRNRL